MVIFFIYFIVVYILYFIGCKHPKFVEYILAVDFNPEEIEDAVIFCIACFSWPLVLLILIFTIPFKILRNIALKK